MQLALKDVGKMSSLPGISALAQSPIWGQPIDKIHPTQLHAFVTRHAEKNQRDLAETAIQICLAEVTRAVSKREIPAPPILEYSSPSRARISYRELVVGLDQMGEGKGAAVLFALETGMSAVEVGRLTWPVATRLFRSAVLSDVAIACTRVCLRQLHLQYVFWQLNEDGVVAPVFGLDHDVYEAFGMVWAELEDAYSRL